LTDHPPCALHSDALVPSGSVTKPWTAVAILQMVERGKIELSTPVHTLIDPVLQRSWHTTLFELWDRQPGINSITFEMLLGHTGGIQDYPPGLQTAVEAGQEFGPKELMDMTDKALMCVTPPCRKLYSSIGYVMLGLAMVQLSGAATWTEWDQFAIIPATRRSLCVTPTTCAPSLVLTFCSSTVYFLFRSALSGCVASF
jgi:CubicO group peptidase (beta-lactamase class C family)